MTAALLVSLTSNVLSITSAAFGATTSFGASVTFSGFTAGALTFLNGTSGTVISSSATLLTVAYNHSNVGSTAANGSELIRATALPNFGWLEKGSITVSSLTKELEVKLILGEDSTQEAPRWVSSLIESGTNVTFRVFPAPDQIYNLKLTYQTAAPSFAATTDTWAPIPDYMFGLVCQGVLAKTYEYLGDERWPITLQTFLKQLISFHGGLTESQVNLFMGDRSLTQAGSHAVLTKSQQAILARGLQ